MSTFGINLGFAIKRWPDPAEWAAVVRHELDLDLVQFSFDLLNPWWPDCRRLARGVRAAAAAEGITIHSAQIGLAEYTYNGLLHPVADARAAGVEWWHRALFVTAEIGANAMGGPVGALSVADLARPGQRERRYAELVETLRDLAERARGEGLDALLVEPTPLPREIPSSIVEAERLAVDLGGSAVPVRYVLDIGHALFRPLYGREIALEDWLTPLAPHVGLLHLQNTDFQSDSHWGWPDDRGCVDLGAFAADIEASGLAGLPVFLELFDAFEAADSDVIARVRTSVDHCRASLGFRAA